MYKNGGDLYTPPMSAILQTSMLTTCAAPAARDASLRARPQAWRTLATHRLSHRTLACLAQAR
jgi:hypothetical protein